MRVPPMQPSTFSKRNTIGETLLAKNATFLPTFLMLAQPCPNGHLYATVSIILLTTNSDTKRVYEKKTKKKQISLFRFAFTHGRTRIKIKAHKSLAAL